MVLLTFGIPVPVFSHFLEQSGIKSRSLPEQQGAKSSQKGTKALTNALKYCP